MNYLELVQAVKRESGLGAASSIVGIASAQGDDLRMFDWVNWAARDITLAREDWRWRRGMATLPSTTSITNAASAFSLTDFASWKGEAREYKPSAYRVSDGVATEKPLTWLEYDQFRKMFFTGTHATGNLQYWSISPAEEFLVGPTPDSAHFIRADYIKDYTDMTADSDIPLIPARWHMLIVWRALMEYGGFDAATEVYQRAERNYTLSWPQLVQSQMDQPSIGSRALA